MPSARGETPRGTRCGKTAIHGSLSNTLEFHRGLVVTSSTWARLKEQIESGIRRLGGTGSRDNRGSRFQPPPAGSPAGAKFGNERGKTLRHPPPPGLSGRQSRPPVLWRAPRVR